jgi:hypothetical protein
LVTSKSPIVPMIWATNGQPLIDASEEVPMAIIRRKTCIFDCSLRLNFSHKRHFATKILLVA